MVLRNFLDQLSSTDVVSPSTTTQAGMFKAKNHDIDIISQFQQSGASGPFNICAKTQVDNFSAPLASSRSYNGGHVSFATKSSFFDHNTSSGTVDVAPAQSGTINMKNKDLSTSTSFLHTTISTNKTALKNSCSHHTSLWEDNTGNMNNLSSSGCRSSKSTTKNVTKHHKTVFAPGKGTEQGQGDEDLDDPEGDDDMDGDDDEDGEGDDGGDEGPRAEMGDLADAQDEWGAGAMQEVVANNFPVLEGSIVGGGVSSKAQLLAQAFFVLCGSGGAATTTSASATSPESAQRKTGDDIKDDKNEENDGREK